MNIDTFALNFVKIANDLNEIETTADFIVVLHDALKQANNPDWLIINPVYEWEKKNWHYTRATSAFFIEDRLGALDLCDYEEISAAYTKACDYIIDNGYLSRLYKMESGDKVGNDIWGGLIDRLKANNRAMAICKFYQEKK